MPEFRNAVVSMPGRERTARTPFGAHVVIHATAEETNGLLGMWETFTPPGQGPASQHPHPRDRGLSGHQGLVPLSMR